MIEVKNCPSCGAQSFEKVFHIEGVFGLRCNECSMVFVSPRPENLTELYTKNIGLCYSDYYTHSYKTDCRVFDRRLELLEKYSVKETILDAGCSVGSFLETAGKRGWMKLMGIEPNPVSADECKKRNLDVLLDFFTPDIASSMREKFDAMYLGDVIEHVESPAEIIHSAGKVLKPHGKLMIVTPNFDSFIARLLQIKPGEHLHYFTEHTLKDIVNRNGFKIVHFELTTRDHSVKALKYSSTFSGKPVLKLILALFHLPGSEYLLNLLCRLFIKDELLVIAEKNK